MDGKLDPSFNTGTELRKLLRDPRQSDVGRRGASQRHASGPMGLYTRAFLIVGVTIVLVIGVFVLVSKSFPQTVEFADTTAWVWLAVSLGTVAGCIFILAKLRGMLTETGGRSAAKAPSAYENTQPLSKDCGIEDDWRDMNGVGWSFFAPLIAGALLSRVLIGQLEPGRGALAELFDECGIYGFWQPALAFAGLALLLYAMHRVLKRKARDE